MPSKDLHDKPFDDSTIAKLEIFEAYVEAWLPTFVMLGLPVISIIDFFAGTGYDTNGVPGSPIRILRVIKKFVDKIRLKDTKVEVYLNEFKKSKFNTLKDACDKYLNDNPDVNASIAISYERKEFEQCFSEWLPIIQKNPCLVFLDQNGIKFLSNKYVHKLESTTKTDFLYFVSSSYFLRFGDSEEFKKHISFDMEEARKDPYSFIHRSLLKQLKNDLPKSSALRLYPFTLKKGSNYHGIIFGAKSLRAVEKFLSIAWDKNSINGEANFDIDEDQKKSQLEMFGDAKPTKIEVFEQNLEKFINSSRVTTNKEIFVFAMEAGHPAKHATECLKKLRKEGKIEYEGRSPKVTFDALSDKDGVITIKWV